MQTKDKSETKNDTADKAENKKKEDIQDEVIGNIMEDKKNDFPEKSINNKNKENYTPKVIAGVVVGLIILFILLVIVMGVGMYKFNWSNQLTRLLPFPAAMVDGKLISYNDYQNDIDTLDFFYNAQSDSIGSVPSNDYLQKTVISRMIRENYLAQYAKKQSLTVTQDEINTEYQVLVTQAGSEEQVNEQLLSLYNWTSDQFKAKVLEPFLIRSKVQDYIVSEDSTPKSTADEVLSKIRNEEITFAEAAAEYSEDVTADSGGELGYFTRGQMVPEFEAAVLALEVGEISDVVKTDYGYHIIKLIEKIEATDDTAEQINAAHILIKTTDIDEWANEQLADVMIRLFVSDFEWKDDCGLVLSETETCEDNNLLDYINTTTTTPTE
ncbi:MAG: peptidylprolyl isomerase [bacterium]|nr:peptidylprolyl isomerase [bacterium]